MGHESEKPLARHLLCENTAFYHRLRCLLFLPQDFASLSPLIIPDISWDVYYCVLARRRVLEIDSSTHQKNLPACVLAAVMQSMAERLHAMNDVDA